MHVSRPHLHVLHDADEGVEAVQIALSQRVQVARRQRLSAHPRQPAAQHRRLLNPQLRRSSTSTQISVHGITSSLVWLSQREICGPSCNREG